MSDSRHIGSLPTGPVPVFNCVLNIGPADEPGQFIALGANLREIRAVGRTEREALAQAVTAFKALVSEAHQRGVSLPWIEPPELVAGRLRMALQYIEPERVHVTPDCGFSQTARFIATRKLASMVEGVRMVRKELGKKG